MNSNFVKIEISDDKSLLHACDLLHDASCDISNYKFEEKTGLWQAVFEREFLEDPDLLTSKPKFIIFAKHLSPLAESILILKRVKSCNIIDKSHIGTYMFNECQVQAEEYRFLFCEDMEMIITFEDKPQGMLIDKKLLNKTISMYSLRNPFRRYKKPTT